jgi:hypothetical protein
MPVPPLGFPFSGGFSLEDLPCPQSPRASQPSACPPVGCSSASFLSPSSTLLRALRFCSPLSRGLISSSLSAASPHSRAFLPADLRLPDPAVTPHQGPRPLWASLFRGVLFSAPGPLRCLPLSGFSRVNSSESSLPAPQSLEGGKSVT